MGGSSCSGPPRAGQAPGLSPASAIPRQGPTPDSNRSCGEWMAPGAQDDLIPFDDKSLVAALHLHADRPWRSRRNPSKRMRRAKDVGPDREVQAMAAGVKVGDGRAHSHATGVVQGHLRPRRWRRGGSYRGRPGIRPRDRPGRRPHATAASPRGHAARWGWGRRNHESRRGCRRPIPACESKGSVRLVAPLVVACGNPAIEVILECHAALSGG